MAQKVKDQTGKGMDSIQKASKDLDSKAVQMKEVLTEVNKTLNMASHQATVTQKQTDNAAIPAQEMQAAIGEVTDQVGRSNGLTKWSSGSRAGIQHLKRQ